MPSALRSALLIWQPYLGPPSDGDFWDSVSCVALREPTSSGRRRYLGLGGPKYAQRRLCRRLYYRGNAQGELLFFPSVAAPQLQNRNRTRTVRLAPYATFASRRCSAAKA